MGLDMYLAAEKYIGGWNHSTDEEKNMFQTIVKIAGTDKMVTSDSPSVTIRTNVAYWRKANAIHAWFVRELAENVDDCRSIHVDIEDMQRLIADCHKALDFYRDEKFVEAGNCMSPQDGCFFGGTNVDESWSKDLKNTIKQLTPLIDSKKCEGFDFYYRASW